MVSIFLIFVMLVAACSRSEPQLRPTLAPNQAAPETVDPKVNRPVGGEINVLVSRSGPNSALVRVTNVSESEVYIAYLPGKKADDVEYIPFTEERKLPGEDEFKRVPTGGDFAPGIRALGPRKSIAFNFYSYESGDYQLKFSYLVDKNVAEFINAGKASQDTQDWTESAWREITTPIIHIEK